MTSSSICVYQIAINKEVFKLGSVSIWLEALTGVDAFILSGPGLFNVSNVIQYEGEATVGAPIVIEASNITAFVVVKLSSNHVSGRI